mgnify:FL=1|jgi:hypothetical protein|tara:strand:- start:643 stop:861 length:219 start_codon:yes stop_codon:yes gene_type:complete
MKLGIKITYLIIFVITYISLLNASTLPGESYSIFFIILFIPTALVIAWVIPQFFKDGVVPILNWLAKFIPKS